MTLSRRALIHAVGRSVGVAAAYRTMAAMGLLPIAEAYGGPPDLPPGEGARVIVLGAGIAGMVLARELGRAGYDVSVLEARARAGGRNWSLRDGDDIVETDSVQRVGWDRGEHLYFNPGPARIPWHHEGILGYCRELDVPLEVMCNDNRGAFLHDAAAFDGKPQRNGAVINDTRGYVAELAAKAVDQSALAHPVSMEDRERLRAMLRAFGALDRDLVYRGSTRAGIALPASVDEPRGNEPLDLRQLLQSDFWQGPIQWGELAQQAPTMLQPVGGMGVIGQAFGRALGAVIRCDARVIALRRVGQGARVIWRDAAGREHAADAPVVLSTMPCSVLRGIDADFAPATRAAIAAVDYVPAAKVAFEAQRRFWELDQSIYGGISWTSRDATQLWYPSAGINQTKGILVGAYIWSQKIGDTFAAKSLRERLADTIADNAAIHPGCAAHLGQGVSVAWTKIPYSLGAWAAWSTEARAAHYATLLAGDGPFLFAGEHLSYVNGWQEGAVRSAHHALRQIAARMQSPSGQR
ncbi:MAG: FAD-dependent oxidoreductase [Alphaproteobacteria bacterium]|nr:FAD-dependent oxidoreductase [Alphaproteobacteria bacterium]